MSYRGMNYEDGWVVAEDIEEKYKSKLYEKLTIIIPSGAKVTKFNIKRDKDTKTGEVLLEYDVNFLDSEYLDYDEDTADETNDDLTVGKEILGNIVRYRSIGGKIADYVIKLNTKKVDNIITKKWMEQVNEIENKLKICEKLKDEVHKLDCRDNIEHLESLEIGKHKANKMEPDGAIIEVYIEVENPIRNGSKFTLASSGGKGTVQYIIPKDKKPYTIDTNLEIDFIATPLSIISRKNPSILLLLYLGKIVYFINKKAEELAKQNKISLVRKLLKETFIHFDKTEDKMYFKQLEGFLENNDAFIKKYILKHDPLNNPAFPVLSPPFQNIISIEDIEKVGKIINVPLQEKVFVPEEDSLTEYPVTVGIMPVYLLEHFPKAMSGVRGMINAKSQLTTGQGRSGTKEGNSAIKIGLYDMFSIASVRPNKVIRELWAIKSDNIEAKKELRKKIVKGEIPLSSEIEINEEDIVTKKLVKNYFYGALLDPQF